MARKTMIDDDAIQMLNGLGERVKESRKKERTEAPFVKPSSDYYRLDLVTRKSVPGSNGHNVLSEEIKTDYKAYIHSVKGEMSITRYIQYLIEQDMQKHNKGGINESKRRQDNY